MLWGVLILVLGGCSVVGAVYLLSRVRRFFPKLKREHPALSWLAALPVLLIPGLFAFVSSFAVIVVLLHLVLFFLLCGGIGKLVNRIRKKEPKVYMAGFAALALTALYLGAGWFFAHHVFETDYAFQTAKELGTPRLRIAALADSHLGLTLSGEDFAAQMQRIADTEPDLVVVVGDFVDDDTDKADMLRACEALGELKTPYGVFFVFGNHDNGYFRHRNFSGEELRAALLSNGVTILEDAVVPLTEHITLIGRRDRSDNTRRPALELTAEADPGDYIVMLDHQPNDYDGEAASGADLVISGHTHGGHVFPAGVIGLLMGANDRVYGTEQRGGTTFLVTSGISGWGIPFKTGAISEYVVIDVEQESK